MPRPRLVHLTLSATIGGIAEVVRAELAHLRGVDREWLTISVDPTTNRTGALLHKALYGAGVHDELAAARPWAALREYGRAEAARLAPQVAGADAVVLHDPLCLTLAAGLRPLVGRVVWRCHVGDDRSRPDAELAVEGLRPHLDAVDLVGFLRAAYVWPGLDPDRVLVLPPGIDPDAPKNRELPAEQAAALLTGGRLPDGPRPVLDDNGTGFLRDPGAPLTVQVSRWDRLKGHHGVLAGFRAVAEADPAVELVLLGPHVDPRRNYPENTAVLHELLAARHDLPDPVRRRVHVWSFRECARDEEALAVNLLQRAATVVAQNSLREGFGLTVTEAMWKRATVLAAAVGGLADQVEDGVSGLLTPYSDGGAEWSERLAYALRDPARRVRWGAAARDRVGRHYLVGAPLRTQLSALGWTDHEGVRVGAHH